MKLSIGLNRKNFNNWWTNHITNRNISFIPENEFLLKMVFLWAGGPPPTLINHVLTAVAFIAPFFLIIPVQLHVMNTESREETIDVGFQIMYFYIISIRQLLWAYNRNDLRILLNSLQVDWDKYKLLDDFESVRAINKTKSLCRKICYFYVCFLVLLVMTYPILPIFQYIFYAATNSFPSNYTMSLPYKATYVLYSTLSYFNNFLMVK